MKVLILGATGFIGLPVAQAFVRAGHLVYGQTRSETKAQQLKAAEIIPVVADPQDISTFAPLLATMDAVIDILRETAITSGSETLLAAIAKAAQELRPPHAPKLTYIYTCGTWVHGHKPDEVITDTTPITDPAELARSRPAQEQRVVTHPHLNGIVIRPALLYGRSGSLIGTLMFKSAYEGQVRWFGAPGGRLSLVHCDDLAELYVLAAEKAVIVRGQIFDAGNDMNESTDAVLQKLVEISGAKGPYTYAQPSNPFEAALATSIILRPYLARALLGWQPRKAGLLDHLPVYYDAWKASEGLS
ncbi:NAD(P)-binding protein [Daedaleopsis nitida]|nr:NAD(P)-binding protein [Daedaleopsis nitida]